MSVYMIFPMIYAMAHTDSATLPQETLNDKQGLGLALAKHLG